MSEKGDSSDSGPRSGFRKDLVTKVVFPVIVSVVGTLAVAVLTPLAENLRELLFPTKVTVVGQVSLPLQRVEEVRVELDNEEKGTFDGAQFFLTDVRAGEYDLKLEILGAKPKHYRLTVSPNESSPKDLGLIEVEPLATLRFSVEETPDFDPANPGTPPPTDYDLILWLEDDDGAGFDEIASVTYTPPTPLSGTRRGKPKHGFCYAEARQIDFGETFGFQASARIELQNGASYTTNGLRVVGVRHPDCPITRQGSNSDASAKTSVPDVRGQTETEAIILLEGAKLNPNVRREYGETRAGIVIAQDPFPGDEVDEGTTVRITVSKGPRPTSNGIPVPDVVSQPFDQARATLEEKGFNVAREDVSSATQRAGVVVGQDPNAGETAEEGSTVTVQVSTGPKTATVPDVTSQDEETAESQINDAGFKSKIEGVGTDDPCLDGFVIDQDPPGGKDAELGSRVTIFIGRYVGTQSCG